MKKIININLFWYICILNHSLYYGIAVTVIVFITILFFLDKIEMLVIIKIKSLFFNYIFNLYFFNAIYSNIASRFKITIIFSF